MAVTKTLTLGSTSNQRPYGVLTVTETATSTANNTSTLSIKLVLKRPSAISSSASKSASCTINGTTYSWSGSIGGSGDLTLISKTQTITHNSDGSKTINISASIALNITWGGVSLGTISNSGTMALTNIPRYATVSQSLTAKTETTATIKWSSDATVDYIWWSTNNGSSWTGINVTDGTGGSYTISGLSANTAYNIKTRVRRKDSQLTTDSSALAVTTYAYPYANSMPNFTIGNKLTIGIFNPLGRNVTVNIIGADNSQISNDTTSGTSITGYNNTTVQNRLYASIPNAKSGTYKVKVTYGSQITTKNGGTYSVNENVCLPSIGGGAYQDTASSVVAITGNNQDIVRNQSVVRYTASGLSAQKSATVATCSVTVNGNTYNLTLSGATAVGGNAQINSGTDVEAVFTVTDSRGLTATRSITVHMLDWHNPSAIISVARQNNFYSQTDINVDAEYPSINGNNTITISYQATKDGDASPSVSGSLQDGVTSVANLDNNYAWTIAITLVDRFGGTTTYNVGISRGMPIIYFDRLKSSVGINCFPQDDESLEVDGFNVARSIMTRSLSANATHLAVNTYTKVPLDLANSVGGKLTATNDGGIQIGSGVSKILVSARASIQGSATTGRRHLRVMKNSYTNNNTIAWSQDDFDASVTEDIVITPTLGDVSENDVIYLWYYVPNTADTLGGNTYGARTSMTVEVVG